MANRHDQEISRKDKDQQVRVGLRESKCRKDTSYEARLASWEKARFAPKPAPMVDSIDPTITEMVPMRDEVRLYTEIFLPQAVQDACDRFNTPYPVILFRSPYCYSRLSRLCTRTVMNRYSEAGYALVFQLTRGQGPSEGKFRRLQDDADDGFDAIQWIAEQPWSNGRVGMAGSSYLGSTQLLAARKKPSALKCIMPAAFVGNFTQCYPFSYGVPYKCAYMQWHHLLDVEKWEEQDVNFNDMTALNHPKWGPALRKRPLIDAADEVLSGDKLDNWKETVSSPIDNDYWRNIHFTDKELAELDLPIFFTDGWYDMTIGPIDFFSRLEKLQPNRQDNYLLVGPWDHYQTSANTTSGEDNGDRIMPQNGAFDHITQRITFFNRYLKEDSLTTVQSDRVRVYISGSRNSNANCWLDLPTFPAPDTVCKRLFLHSQGNARSFLGDGILNWSAPTDKIEYQTIYRPSDHYTYNPVLPTASVIETFRDRRDVEIRADVLTYTSEPFIEPLTILGNIRLILHAASDALDTDWFAVLTEVYPCGQSKSFHYAPPAFRARYRHGMDREAFLTPNQSEKFEIPLGPAGHQIAVGNRLRLSIFSAAFPEFEPNTNTGAPAATDTDQRIAQQTIYHETKRPSHIILPVIDLGIA